MMGATSSLGRSPTSRRRISPPMRRRRPSRSSPATCAARRRTSNAASSARCSPNGKNITRGASSRSCARSPRCGRRTCSIAIFTTFRNFLNTLGSWQAGVCRVVASQSLTRISPMRARRAVRYVTAGIFAALTAAASLQAGAEGLAPDPAKTREAVVQVYGARTMGVKGLFGVHTWVAVKPTDALSWTVYEIIGWRLRWSDSALVVRERQPDAPWFGSDAELYADHRGTGVDALIMLIDQVAPESPNDTPSAL